VKLLDRLFPRGVPDPPRSDPVAYQRELEVLSGDDEFARWLEATNVGLSRGVDPEDRARSLLEEGLKRDDKLSRDLEACRVVAATEKGHGPATKRVARLEEERELLDRLVNRIWGVCNRPVVGHPSERPEPTTRRCQGCGKASGRPGELLRAPGVGLCIKCKAKRLERPERDEIDELVEQIGGR
jgi:hypothetical protein